MKRKKCVRIFDDSLFSVAFHKDSTIKSEENEYEQLEEVYRGSYSKQETERKEERVDCYRRDEEPQK